MSNVKKDSPHVLLQVGGTIVFLLVMSYVAAGMLVPLGLTTDWLAEPMSESTELLLNIWLFGFPAVTTTVLSKWILDVPVRVSLSIAAITLTLVVLLF